MLAPQNTELKLKVDTAERERDFYFEKLRDIEILCQAPELQAIPAIRIVEKILYAADSGMAFLGLPSPAIFPLPPPAAFRVLRLGLGGMCSARQCLFGWSLAAA